MVRDEENKRMRRGEQLKGSKERMIAVQNR